MHRSIIKARASDLAGTNAAKPEPMILRIGAMASDSTSSRIDEAMDSMLVRGEKRPPGLGAR